MSFEQAWPRRRTVTLAGLSVPIIGRDNFITNKRAMGRMRDLADVEDLESSSIDFILQESDFRFQRDEAGRTWPFRVAEERMSYK